MDNDTFKTRAIRFRPPHPDPDQAGSARTLLRCLPGIDAVTAVAPARLVLRYDLRVITLRDIEQHLEREGLRLDGGLLRRLKRALIHYCEDTQRANLLAAAPDPLRRVAMQRYRRLRHGCRDRRAGHWRRYL